MEITSQMLTQFGMMNKISTGYMLLDVLLCLLMPMVVSELLPRVMAALGHLRKRPEEYVRVIEHTDNGNYWDEGNRKNKVLQDAVTCYLNSLEGVADRFPVAGYTLLDLEPAASKGDCGSDDESEDNWSYEQSQLRRYHLTTVPPTGTSVCVHPGITLHKTVETSQATAGSSASVTTTLSLTSDRPGGQQLIDAFVQRAFEHYRGKKLGEEPGHRRHLYMPVTHVAGSGGKPSQGVYKRYELSGEKTFDSFFHPEKEAILRLVDRFNAKTGKFAIPGYPHKLGLLLHGPPGTGKTSFIKALAAYSDRSIISVPLARIRTNQELMDIMFARTVQVEGEEVAAATPFRKICHGGCGRRQRCGPQAHPRDQIRWPRNAPQGRHVARCQGDSSAAGRAEG